MKNQQSVLGGFVCVLGFFPTGMLLVDCYFLKKDVSSFGVLFIHP